MISGNYKKVTLIIQSGLFSYMTNIHGGSRLWRHITLHGERNLQTGMQQLTARLHLPTFFTRLWNKIIPHKLFQIVQF